MLTASSPHLRLPHHVEAGPNGFNGSLVVGGPSLLPVAVAACADLFLNSPPPFAFPFRDIAVLHAMQ
jgi:hypothetical protein